VVGAAYGVGDVVIEISAHNVIEISALLVIKIPAHTVIEISALLVVEISAHSM